jgi:hypothetical protein
MFPQQLQGCLAYVLWCVKWNMTLFVLNYVQLLSMMFIVFTKIQDLKGRACML